MDRPLKVTAPEERWPVTVPARVPELVFWFRVKVIGALAPVPVVITLLLPSSKVTVVEKVALAPTLEGGSVLNTSLAVTVVLGLEVALVMFAVVVEAAME